MVACALMESGAQELGQRVKGAGFGVQGGCLRTHAPKVHSRLSKVRANGEGRTRFLDTLFGSRGAEARLVVAVRVAYHLNVQECFVGRSRCISNEASEFVLWGGTPQEPILNLHVI